MRFEAEIDNQTLPVEVTETEGRYRVEIGGEIWQVDARRVGEGIWSLIIGDASLVADLSEQDDIYAVHVDGESYRIRVEEETRYLIRTRGAVRGVTGQILKAPMPGRVTLIAVTAGQAVEPGDGLVILEAMKMENELKAVAKGRVKEIRVQVGQAVNPGAVLLVIE